MYGRLLAVKNASQSVICRGDFEAACLNADIFFSPNRPISENLIFLSEPLPKHFYFIRKFSNLFLNILIQSGSS
jgi:hypothetical protein